MHSCLVPRCAKCERVLKELWTSGTPGLAGRPAARLNAWNPPLKLPPYRGGLLLKITDMKTQEQKGAGGRRGRERQSGASDLCSGTVKMAWLASITVEGGHVATLF
jgi:hypothetical protein